MSKRPSKLVLLALLLALSLVAAACGGDEAADPVEEDVDPAAEETIGGDATEEGEAGQTAGVEAPGVQELIEEGTVRVGVKYDQPLFGVQTPNGIEGFDAEIARLIVEGMFRDGDPDSHIEFREAVSANREPFLQNDEVDMVIATYTMNEERDELVDFAGPYYQTGQQLMVIEGNPEGIETPEDLNTPDLTTCSAEGSTSIQRFEEIAPEADIITFDTYSRCAQAMLDGRVDATTTDGAILYGLVDEFGGLEVVGEEFSDEPYGVGLAQDATDLRLFINERICEIQQNGEWQEAFENTVGVVAETPDPPAIGSILDYEQVFPEGSNCEQDAGATTETSTEMMTEATEMTTEEPTEGTEVTTEEPTEGTEMTTTEPTETP